MAGRWKTKTFFALSLPDRPGELANFAAQLADAGIRLIGLWGYVPGVGEPRIACVPESATLFREFFASVDMKIDEGITFYLAGYESSNDLVRALQKIGGAGINIESIEFISNGLQSGCFIWIDQSDVEQMKQVLAAS